MVTMARAKKELGQNFLMHARIAERIAKTAGIEGKTVFEIGPGTGMLTRELLKLARKVIALEADAELFDGLRRDFAGEIAAGRLELIKGDVRAFDIDSLTKGYALVANIPYYLTGEIFRKFLEADNQPASITLLVQKEVAERIARSAKESVLSLSVKAYGTPRYEFTVPRGAFSPAPNVDSAVLSVREVSRDHFQERLTSRGVSETEKMFFRLLHAGFAHKRKFVRKNLADAGLPAGGLPEKARAEDVPLPEWLALAREG